MGLSEKEILADALESEKQATGYYNMFSNECVHNNVRDAILKCLDEEHEIQQSVFEEMHARGYYPTPAADSTKVDQVKQKFAQCVK